MEWQPIETAPKDGTEIDIYAHGRRIVGCKFAQRWVQIVPCGDGFEWYMDILNPTHWMPLPTPPEADSSSPK